MGLSDVQTKAARPSPLIPYALAGAAALVLGSGALFYYASQTARGPERGAVHKVTVIDGSCDPANLTIPAGRSTFEIHNGSARPIEWEILDGVYVLEERENIAPGFHSLLTAKLQPGTYKITCGLLSSPRATLTVTPSEQSEAERIQPPLAAFVGPISEYKVYLVTQSTTLLAATETLVAAVRSEDMEAAKQAWRDARLPYKRMESVTNRVADLETAIDPLPDYLEAREADPAFTGFHRIEYGLFGQNSLEGLAPVAEKLLADVTELKARLRGLKLSPEDLAGNAGREAVRLSEGQIAGGEDRWSFHDLPELAADLDGIEKGVGLVLPLVAGANPDAAKRVTDDLAAAREALDTLKLDTAWPGYDAVDAEARGALAAAFRALAESISALNPAIGLG